MDELEKFLQITKRINRGLDVPAKDLEFYTKFSGGIDDDRLKELNDRIKTLRDEKKLDPDLNDEAIGLAVQKLQTDPTYRETMLKIAEKVYAGEVSGEIAQGLNVLLAGSDILTSAQQIAQSKNQLSKTRRPSKPAIPQRDQYLQQALRGAQEGDYGVSQTIAPARAEIQDNYQADIQNAKTAATGQAGAFGSYAQVASNRRNQAALGLGELSNRVRQQNRGMYNDLVGMRMNETQNQFDNQARYYPTELNQYNNEIQAAGQLGSTGRANMRDSLANLGQIGSQVGGNIASSQRYRTLYNNLKTIAPDSAGKVMDSIKSSYYNRPFDINQMESTYNS